MAMSAGGTGKAQLNVTPMIDILLVLLIIFMVIQPDRSAGLDAAIPQPARNDLPPTPSDDVVITVLRDQAVRLNQEVVSLRNLDERLRLLFRNRGGGVIFIGAEKDLDFGRVAQVIDMARGAGLTRIALMPLTAEK